MSIRLFNEFDIHVILCDDWEALQTFLKSNRLFKIDKNNINFFKFALSKGNESIIRSLAALATKPVMSWAIRTALYERKYKLVSF